MKKILLGTAVGSLFCATSAFANPCYTEACGADAAGPYIGLELGYGWLDKGSQGPIDDSGELAQSELRNLVSPTANYDGSDNGLDGFSGAINFGYLFPITDSFFLGPEVGYMFMFQSPDFKWNFSDSLGQTDTLKYKIQNSTIIPLLAVARVNVSEDFYLFAKLGVSYVHQKLSIDEYQGLLDPIDKKALGDGETASNWQFTGVAGVGWQVSESIGLTVQYTYVDGDKFSDLAPTNYLGATSPDIDTIAYQAVTAGLTYSF